MANPTTNLNITLPEPGAESSRGVWGSTINDAFQSLDTGIADRSVPSGGTDDQILTKDGTTDYETEWSDRLGSVAISGSDGIEVDSGSPLTANGTIALGVNKSTMLSFLNAEDGATADQTNAEIKTAYEANSDTNEFSDAEQTKLSGIETSATADQTGAQIKTLYQAETSAFTDAQFTKLANIETSATADQTGAQIKTLYQAESNAFTDAQFTKLAAIESSATVDQSDAEIKTAYENNSDTNEFSDAEQTKLSGIETAAKADQTGAEIKTAYQAETNAFTDAQFTKLAGIETAATADQTVVANVTVADTAITTIAITQQEHHGGEVLFGSSSHGLAIDQPIVFTEVIAFAGRSLPTLITEGLVYYVQAGEATAYHCPDGLENNFHVSTVPGGSNVATTVGDWQAAVVHTCVPLCSPLFVTEATGDLPPKSRESKYMFDPNSGSLFSTTFVGALTGNANTVTTNATLTGDVTSSGNATTIAGLAMSKTALVAGAGLTLTTNTLSVDADQSGQITSVGTIGTGTWNGTPVAQAYIADQAINEAKLQVSNSPTNNYVLTAQSGNAGGMTWAAPAVVTGDPAGTGVAMAIALG